jgi:hypothetical protein
MSILSKIKEVIGLNEQPAPEIPKDCVPMPEVAQGAFLQMDLETLQQIELDLGEDYWSIMGMGFLKPSPLIISRVLALCLKNGEPEKAPWGLSIEELGKRLYDVQIRTYQGITLAEAVLLIEEQRREAMRAAAE